MTEDEENKKPDKWCWVCRFCDNTGPWQTEDQLDKKYPRGWKYDDDIGLRCGNCVKAGRTQS